MPTPGAKGSIFLKLSILDKINNFRIYDWFRERGYRRTGHRAAGVQAIWRVHPARYRPAEFRSGSDGDARFSPIRNSRGAVIPTWYGARTVACAMMETVLHDVPAPPTDYILDIERLRDADICISRIRYKRCREWAMRLHTQTPARGAALGTGDRACAPGAWVKSVGCLALKSAQT